MTNSQLIDYVKRHLDRGDSRDKIKTKLITEGGWDSSDVEEAFKLLGVSVVKKPAPSPIPVVTPPSPPRQPIQANPAFSPRPAVFVPPVIQTPSSVPKPEPVPVPLVSPRPVPSKIPSPAPVAVTQAPIQTQEEPTSQFPPVSKFYKPLPATPPSRTFDQPRVTAMTPSKRSRSTGTLMNIIILILVILLIGLGIFAYFKYFSNSSPQIQNTQTTATDAQVNTQNNIQASKSVLPEATSIVVDNSHYSFTLPSGWESASSTSGNGVQANKNSDGYKVTVAITPIPKSAGTVTSVDQIINQKTIPTIIDSEFPGAKISTSTSGYLGGKQAAIITFTATSTSSVGTQSQVKSLAMRQYSAVNNDTLYTLVFIVDLSKSGTTAVQDLKEITDSFKFK